VQPSNNKEWNGQVLKNLGVTTILNVSSDHKANKKHKEWYESMGIQYKEIPVWDYIDPPFGYYNKFLTTCVEWYHSLEKDKRCVLIHCTAGVNRSNSAACAILWSQIFYPSRQYSEPFLLIEWMKERQLADRSFGSFLTNELLKKQLWTWCKENQFYRRKLTI